MFKIFVSNLGEEERIVFLQGFKAVPGFLLLLNQMLITARDKLGNLDPTDPKMLFEYVKIRAERDLLLEMIQVIEE